MPKVEIDSEALEALKTKAAGFDAAREVLEILPDFVEQSVGFAAKQAEIDAAVAERGPKVVETLLSHGFIDSDRKQAALKAVRNPLKVLESLEKTAQAKVKMAAANTSTAPDNTLGKGEEVKEAGVGAGADKGESSTMAAANNRFMRSLGF